MSLEKEVKHSLGSRNLHYLHLLPLGEGIQVTVTQCMPKTQDRIRKPSKTAGPSPQCRINPECRRVIVKTGKWGGRVPGHAFLRQVGQDDQRAMELRNLAPPTSSWLRVSSLLSHGLG